MPNRIRVPLYALLISLLVTLTSYSTFAQSCEAFLSRPKLNTLSEILIHDSAISNTSWPGYKVSAFTIFFLDQTNFPGCMAIWANGHMTAQSLDLKIETPKNGIYDYCGKIGNPCPAINSGSVPDTAMIYRLDNALESLASAGFVPPKIDLTMIAHEGFHVFGQSMLRTADHWPTIPALDQMPDRDLLIQRCYSGSSEIQGLVNKEITLLQEALHESLGANNLALIRSKISEFSKTRQTRYLKLAELSMSARPQPSCASAEAEMELIEGTADFVGLYTAQNLNAMSKQEIEKYLDLAIHSSNGPGELYYRFGAMALLIIRNSDPANFGAIIENIKNAKDAERTVIYNFLNWGMNSK